MKTSTIVTAESLRTTALLASRGSFGWRRHRLADLIARARAFEAWLKRWATGRTTSPTDYASWLQAKQALNLAVEDSRFDRKDRAGKPYDTRTILRRAEAYRAYLGGQP